jgi:nitrogen regulatory protein PII
MTRIEVLLPPAQLDEVRDALAEVGVHDMTLSEVKVVAPGSRRRNVYRGSTYVVDFTSKVKMEIDVRDRNIARIVEVLRASLGTAEADKAKVLLFGTVELRPTVAGDPPTASVSSARA